MVHVKAQLAEISLVRRLENLYSVSSQAINCVSFNLAFVVIGNFLLSSFIVWNRIGLALFTLLSVHCVQFGLFVGLKFLNDFRVPILLLLYT